MRPVVNQILLLPILLDQRFCVISAWHRDRSDEANRMEHEDLRIRLENLDLSIIELRCNYSYLYKEYRRSAEEKSFFVPNGDVYHAILLAEKYEQVTILYKREAKLEIVDRIGRILSTFSFTEEQRIEDFRAAYVGYLLSRNQDIREITDISLARLHIPTQLESMLRFKNREGLAASEWIELV